MSSPSQHSRADVVTSAAVALLTASATIAALLLVVPLISHAADQTVLGKRLLVKDPSTPDKRRIVAKAKEVASDNSIVGDPVANGALLTVTAEGGTSSSESYNLPTGTDPTSGKPFWSGDATEGFKYKDPMGTNGPVKMARIKKTGAGVFELNVVIIGKFSPVSVVPPNDGTEGCVLFEINGGDSYSIKFADGEITNKGATLFISKPTSEGSCVTPVTQCGNGLVDTGEQCDSNGTTCGTGAPCGMDCTCPCDFLDPSVCMFPFPSDFLTVADPSTATGRRVHFSNAGMPRNNVGTVIESSDYNWSDGFSPGTSIVLRIPNIDLAVTGAAPITDIERSLDAGAPIVVVNASTLAHHLIWAEIDSNASTEANRAVGIRAAVNFEESTRYIVALRQMKNGSGAIIPPGATFLAYRDNTPTGDPVKEARRAHMEGLFTTLAAAGIPRNDLYLAWDFTVASAPNNTERLLFMRDDAFSRLGASAPGFTVTAVENNLDSRIYRRVTGTFAVERYVNSTTPGARFALGPDGLPLHQATPQIASFICTIPRAALPTGTTSVTPGRASLYGHGFLATNAEINHSTIKDMGNEHNFVFCGTNWIGLAAEDLSNAQAVFGDFSKAPSVSDRLQQAVLDQLFLARLMIHPQGFVSDPAFRDFFGTPVIDTSAVFYQGISNGGIMGGTTMAVAQDITRGVLDVPGMNYFLMFPRTVHRNTFLPTYVAAYPNELERPLHLALIQMLFDRADPNGYAHHMTTDPLPNTPPHKVLLHLAFGDFQVPNIATEIEARTIGAAIHQPAIAAGRHSDVNPYYGIPAIPSYPFDGSALIVWDSGTPTPPTTNTPPTTGADSHGDPRTSVDSRVQRSEFLKVGGAVVDVCAGAPCVP